MFFEIGDTRIDGYFGWLGIYPCEAFDLKAGGAGMYHLDVAGVVGKFVVGQF